MKNIGYNIRKIREQRGYSQEYLAGELKIKQATYARIENGEIKLSINRLLRIAEILETYASSLLYPSKKTIRNQTNHNDKFSNGYVDNLHIESKETTDKLIRTLNNKIVHMEEEIRFLRNLAENNSRK